MAKDTEALVKEVLRKINDDHAVKAAKSERDRLDWIERYKQKRAEEKNEREQSG